MHFLDVKGPVRQIEVLHNGQVSETIRITRDGHSASITQTADKTFKGQLTYDPARRRLDYVYSGAKGKGSRVTLFSEQWCVLRIEETPAPGSGFPATVTVNQCDSKGRLVTTEVKLATSKLVGKTTYRWAQDGLSAAETTHSTMGNETRQARYDRQGRFVSDSTLHDEGIQSATTVTFRDDARGNWLERRMVTKTTRPCAPDPYLAKTMAKYGLKCEPDPEPITDVDQRRILYY